MILPRKMGLVVVRERRAACFDIHRGNEGWMMATRGVLVTTEWVREGINNVMKPIL